MRKVIALVLIFTLAMSCKKEDKTYYPNGSLKTVVGVSNSKFHGPFKAFYENGELEIEGFYEYGAMQGMFTYYRRPEHQFSKSEMLFKNDTVYYWWNYNKSGKLVEEGSVKEDFKVGKWMYYDIEDGYTKKIREVFYINGESHLNQEWSLNRQGDTIGGYYYKIKANDPLDFHNQVIRFRVDWIPYYMHSEIYVCIPKKDSKQFNEHFSNEKEVVFDTISNPLLWKGANDIVVNLKYETPGKKLLRGFLLEKKSLADVDTVDYDHVTRKVYFEKEIYIKDRTGDNFTLP